MFYKPSQILILALLVLAIGCKAFSKRQTLLMNAELPLNEATAAMAGGELFRARQLVDSFLEVHPHHKEGEKMMAEILSQEIGQHKEAFEPSLPEELSLEGKSSELKTWLERAHTFLRIGKYEEAVLAAEEALTYDPNSVEASQLIDEIKGEAVKEGAEGNLLKNHVVYEEIDERVEHYREQAREAVDFSEWGQARMAVEKVLLLVPEDPEALRLQEMLHARRKIESV